MRISRREFACSLAGIGAAACKPLLINELRIYARGSTVPPLEILRRNGILPQSIKQIQDGTACLFAFGSLEARVKAWDRFNSDEGWCAIRDKSGVAIKEMRIYPGGKIFEMSL